MWSTGLFDCCADVPMGCFTIFSPCFAFGRNAEILDGTKNSCWTAAAVWWALQHTVAMGCLYSAPYRESPVPDSVIHCLCWPCAFCQEHRGTHAAPGTSHRRLVGLKPPTHHCRCPSSLPNDPRPTTTTIHRPKKDDQLTDPDVGERT